jgi:hypothetical protein
MVDVGDDASCSGYRRAEVLTESGRRRSNEARALIVAATLEPGAVIARVARPWQVYSQQVFTLRREMRHRAMYSFVPIKRSAVQRAGTGLSAPYQGSSGWSAQAGMGGEESGSVGEGSPLTVGLRGVITPPGGARVLLAIQPVDPR